MYNPEGGVAIRIRISSIADCMRIRDAFQDLHVDLLFVPASVSWLHFHQTPDLINSPLPSLAGTPEWES
jgi:hypothetical protein